MANEPNALVYVPTRKIIFATNTFVNVPTVLRVDGVSMIEVVQEQEAGYTVQIPIFHNDGTKLAVAKGSRLILTDAGKAAGLSLRHPNKMTVCEWGG